MPGVMDTSFLQTQVTTIITQLNSIFDEIGVPRNERESRETEVRALRIYGIDMLIKLSYSQHYPKR